MHTREGRVQRYPQVGDTVFVAEHGYGRVIYDLIGSLEFTVQFRAGHLQDVHANRILVVHHNIKSKSKPDLEGRLKEAQRTFESVEELDFEIVRGHFRAMNFGLELPLDADFDLNTLLSIHEEMFGVFQWGGRLRHENEELIVGRKQWKTPSPASIPALMEDFERLVRQTRNDLQHATLNSERMLYLLARVYFEMCVIHPFWDGNGRTSRLLIELLALNSRSPCGFNWSAIPRFGNRTDRAFEKARMTEGRNLRWITDLLRAARDRSQTQF